MYDPDDVSDIGTLSSALYDEQSPDHRPTHQAPESQTTSAQPVPERTTPQSVQTRTAPLPVQTGAYDLDPSDVSDLGTPSSVLDDDSSESQAAERAATDRSPPQRRVQPMPGSIPFQELLKHREPYQPLEPKPPEPKLPELSPIEQPFEPDKFIVDYEPLHRLMATKDIYLLRSYIERNYVKIVSYDFLATKIAQLLMEFGPTGTYVDPHGNPGMIVFELRRILQEMQKKWAMFDVSVKDLGLLKSSEITAKILSSKERISEVLEAAYKRAYQAEQRCDAKIFEMLELENQMEQLRKQLADTQKEIRNLRGEHLYEEEEIPSNLAFMKDLQVELHLQENLNSSLNEQIQKERKTNEQLWQNILELQRQYLDEHDKRMRELSEAAKDAELGEGVREAVLEKVKSLTANPEEVKKAVSDWMQAIYDAMEGKKEAFQDLTGKAKRMDDMVAAKQTRLTDLKKKVAELDFNLNNLETRVLNKTDELEKRQDNYTALVARVKHLENFYREKCAEADEMSEKFYSFVSTTTPKTPLSVPRPPKKGDVQRKSFGYVSRLGPVFETSDDSPEAFRRGTPEYTPRYQDETPPFSFESTPSERMGNPSEAGPSPLDLQSYDTAGPSGINPATRTISGVTNRIDVGKSFNMQTVHGGESTPYRQVTRVDSSLPQSGPIRMSDLPLNVRHRAEFTPDEYMTPFISKSRFGYTDPTARVLNVPPDPGFIVPTGFKKTVVLTSPKRQEPLLVSIDVDPKPLTETDSGEHFICDISLDLQAGSQRRLSTVFTYDEPPDVTPTSDRRHGLFTPRGIFKKKHFNIRRVHWPDEYQSPNLPWSPHDLSDAASPISQLVRSPYISDSSISWERGPESPYSPMNRTFGVSPPVAMNRTFDVSPPAAINRTFGVSPHAAMNRTFGVSPPVAMNRTFDVPPPAAMNRTFDKSMSPVIKGPYYGMSPETDSSFDKSSSYEIGSPGTSYSTDSNLSPGTAGPSQSHRSRSPGLGRTFDTSPSPGIVGSSDRSRSPGLGRTFDMSPGIAGASHRRRSPAQEGTFDRTPSPGIAGPSHRRQSPGLGRTFDKSSSPEFDRTYGSHMQQSPEFGKTYDSHMQQSSPFSPYAKSGSPRYDSEFDTSGSYRQSTASRLDGAFDRSSYSHSGSSYSGSPSLQRKASPRVNQTFSRSPSPELTADDSLLDQGFYQYDTSEMNRSSSGSSFSQ